MLQLLTGLVNQLQSIQQIWRVKIMAFAESSWDYPPKLSGNDVHVWRVSLEQPQGRVQQLLQTLPEEERIRSDRFQFERDRRRFIVGRGMLRVILGLYLDVKPSRLQIRYGTYGKPYLMEKSGEARLEFNLSHSHELALYAFTLGRKTGIDIEYIRHVPDAGQIAARFFSKHENSMLNAIPASQKQEAFFNCWTRKEAYIKAIGNGLAQPLDKFDVSLIPGEPARLLRVEENPEEASRWSLIALNPAQGYAAALAVEGHGWQLRWVMSDE